MRVAVVFFSDNKNNKLANLSNSLAEGIRSQGHQVDVIDAYLNADAKMSTYNYIAIGAFSLTVLGGKIPLKITSFLSNSGLIRGKRSYAFLSRGGLRSQKSLKILMDAMEHEGMFLKKSDIIATTEEAEIIGKKLHI